MTASGADRLRIDVTLRDPRQRARRGDRRRRCAALEGVDLERVSDRTFLMHLGGKLRIESKVPIRNRDDLSMIYTPGVARICQAIAARTRRTPGG